MNWPTVNAALLLILVVMQVAGWFIDRAHRRWFDSKRQEWIDSNRSLEEAIRESNVALDEFSEAINK